MFEHDDNSELDVSGTLKILALKIRDDMIDDSHRGQLDELVKNAREFQDSLRDRTSS